LATKVAEALLGCVRAEDRIARIDELRFAVLATEAGESDTLAARLSNHVRKHLRTLGAEGKRLAVVVASVDCQYDEMSKQELLLETEKDLAVAILESEDIPFPPESSTSLGPARKAS
jgi:GGDEF domain-containing protein